MRVRETIPGKRMQGLAGYTPFGGQGECSWVKKYKESRELMWGKEHTVWGTGGKGGAGFTDKR